MRRGNRRRGAAGHGHRLDLDGAAAATQAAVPRPEPFQPFAVGYVDLGPLRVESPLTGHSVDEWRIGETVELVVASNDEPVRSFAFAAVPPAGNGPAPQTEAAT